MEAKKILLTEDDPNNVELTLIALEEHNLENEVVVVRDRAPRGRAPRPEDARLDVS